jgi:hypothetical protein
MGKEGLRGKYNKKSQNVVISKGEVRGADVASLHLQCDEQNARLFRTGIMI